MNASTVPPADAYGVATFYGLLSMDLRPPRVLHVCEDVVCQCQGSGELIESLEQRFGAEHQDCGGFTWLRSPCLGQCDRAPAALMTEAGAPVREHVLAPAEPEQAFALLEGDPVPEPPPASVPQQGDPDLRLLRRIGVVDPHSLHDYRARDGFEALRRAIELGKAGVIREVKDSGLMGRGGAAFPTGVKWEAVSQQPAHPHYLICNADESEPGTFKDRAVLEGDPFAVIEAMTIAAYATDCSHGFIYLRGEYPNAHEILEHALSVCRQHGYLGSEIMGEGFDFDIEIRQGAGAYICGEETAIFNSIEGYRGEPRAKPPFPTVRGLFGKPTVVNNVETLVNVPEIVLNGGLEYARTGTEKSTGTRAVLSVGPRRAARASTRCRSARRSAACSSAPAGAGSGKLQAVLLGGAAGGFVGPDELDLELTFEGARAAGATLGSGVVVAIDDTVDLRPAAVADRRLLPRRVLWPVHALPGGHGAPGGGAGAAAVGQDPRRRRRGAGAARATSGPACATRRSAGWGRPPTVRSPRRSTSLECSRRRWPDG